MHVQHVNFVLDSLRREPDALLEAWWSLRDVANAVAATGARCTVFQASWKNAVRYIDGVTYRFVAEDSLSGLRGGKVGAVQKLRRLVAEVAASGPDVVHLHGLAFPVQTRYLTHQLRGVPILVQDHGSSLPRGLRRLVHSWGFRRIAGVVFTAREQATPFLKARILSGRVQVFEVVESSSGFTPGSQAEARTATGLAGDPCLLWLANLDENKDPLTALEAFAEAKAALPDAQFWCFYRSGALFDSVCERIAADPRLATCVHLMGATPHHKVESLLRAADFLVQASHREGSGYAVIEALACGTTPIVTDIPSFRRITGNGLAGALVPPGDANAMARAMIEWSCRDRQELRLAARDHFDRTLSFNIIGAQLRAAYERLVAAR